MSSMRFACTVISLCTSVALARSEDWIRFRGPDGSAVSQETGLPTTWSGSQNVVWRTKLPGLGSSSPIVVYDRIYLTCYSGYGLVPNEGDPSQLMRHLVCLDRKTGQIAWVKEFKPELPESEYSGGNSSRHGYSSSTPTSDGERLYVFFGKSGVFCTDLDGNPVWHTHVGSKAHNWGSGNSPILYRDLLIVNASVESDSLVALNKMTGEEVWRTGDMRGCRNTPVLVDLADGRTELVLSTPGRPIGYVVGYDPTTGSELWRCEGIPDRGYVVPSVVAHDGIVYAIGGRKNTALAVRAGGRGDVTKTHRLWSVDRGSNVSSPVYYDRHLYWFHESRGVAYCLNAETGQIVYEARLEPRPGLVYSSVAAADGKLYAFSQYDGAYVLAAKPEFELLAHNVFGGDESRLNASPVFEGGHILIRNDSYLYCLGKK